MADKDICVLGAGLAGLSAAWHLQKKGVACRIFEKEPHAGGLCRSTRLKGFTFDHDGHLLHFRSKGGLALVRKLLGDNMARHQRKAWVFSHDRFIPYPFQSNLHALPAKAAKECLDGFIQADARRTPGSPDNFAQWIRAAFGAGIARHFMVPYNTKFWTVPPEKLTCAWLDGFIPQPTRDQVIDGAGHEPRTQAGYNAHFWYPKRGGIDQLARAFQTGIKDLYPGHDVRRIDMGRREIRFGNGVAARYGALITTIPMPELPKIISGIPKDVMEDFRLLRWNSVFNLNLGLRQKAVTDKHWIYFPQKNLSFFRVGFYHNFSADLVPPGGSSLYAEVSYSDERPLMRRGLTARIERDLKKVGLIAPGDKVVCRDAHDIHYAYPLYDRNYERARGVIIKFLNANGIFPCGRAGSWRYMSMEDVMLEGKSFARDHGK
jgi:UDP-galactopyranose mutase